MKQYVPNYYGKFNCIADKCLHSCCIGWEIDIDNDTYEKYKNVKGEFSDRLKRNIEIKDDCACFKLSDDERCPFLNSKGLCDIILNMGEDALCQICTDHPRFRNFYSDRVEMGLGFCCEEVARLILDVNDNFELVETANDGICEATDSEELEFFKIRNEIFEIIRHNNFSSAVEILLNKFNTELPKKTANEWRDIFLKLERLDENWSMLLNKINSNDILDASLPCYNDKALCNLLTYFIYRHLGECVYDGCFKGRLIFSILSCLIISALCEFESIYEVTRMYSSEIEYSDKNLTYLINIIKKP